MRGELVPNDRRSTGLVDVLDRVLDKGLVVAGDIRVSLAEVELLTIRIRLIICSLDKAQEIGLDWWRYDRNLSLGGLGGESSRTLTASRAGETPAAKRRRARAVVAPKRGRVARPQR
jgi:hypothetical protein